MLAEAEGLARSHNQPAGTEMHLPTSRHRLYGGGGWISSKEPTKMPHEKTSKVKCLPGPESIDPDFSSL